LNCRKKLKSIVMTLALGLQPKQKQGKVRTKTTTQESHLHSQKCERMNPHISKWMSTLGIWTPIKSQIFKEVFQGSKFIGIKSSLYHRCLKWVHMTHLST